MHGVGEKRHSVSVQGWAPKCGGYFPEHAKVAHSPFTDAARPCHHRTGSAELEFQLPYENMTMARRGGYLIETHEVMPLKRQRGTSKANIYSTSKKSAGNTQI